MFTTTYSPVPKHQSTLRPFQKKARRCTTPLSEDGADSVTAGDAKKTPNKSRRRLRKVKFDMTKTKKYKRGPMDKRELHERWFSSKETGKMKEKAFSEAKAFSQQDQQTRFGNGTLYALLGKLLEVCCKAKQDTDKTLLKRKDLTMLVECLSAAPERVGLESAINPNLMLDKVQRRSEVLRKVMAEQGNGEAATIYDLLHTTNCQYYPVDAKEIARISTRYSLPSRLLALHLGQAIAATQEQ